MTNDPQNIVYEFLKKMQDDKIEMPKGFIEKITKLKESINECNTISETGDTSQLMKEKVTFELDGADAALYRLALSLLPQTDTVLKVKSIIMSGVLGVVMGMTSASGNEK